MTRTVSQKMGIKEGCRAYIEGFPEAVKASVELPTIEVSTELTGQFDYMHVFLTSQAEMDSVMPRLKPHLGSRGMLWVSWPKARQLGTDLSLPKVIEIGYSHGLVESVCLSVNDTWSALKFTPPKPGKVYQNSYGRLPDDAQR
jgi:hypothetical protein